MPFFNFHCSACDATVELLVGGSETPDCPTCGGGMKKLLACSVPPGNSKAIMKASRQAAARAGHLSNFRK